MIGFKQSQVLSLMQSVSLRTPGQRCQTPDRLLAPSQVCTPPCPGVQGFCRRSPLQENTPARPASFCMNNLNSTARNQFNQSIISLWYHLPLYFWKLRICVFFVWHKMAVLEHSRFNSLEEYGSCTGREEGPCSRGPTYCAKYKFVVAIHRQADVLPNLTLVPKLFQKGDVNFLGY